MTPRSADRDLIDRALAGQGDAVREFLRRMRCVPRMLGAQNARYGRPFAPDELEDVIQDTLLAVWKKLDGYDGRAALETWVHQFCFLEFLRRLRGKRQASSRVEADVASEHLAEPDEGREYSLLDYEEAYEALASLPSEVADVLWLKHFEDLTFEALGQRLGISINTAKTRYYRGLDKLRALLGERTRRRVARREV